MSGPAVEAVQRAYDSDPYGPSHEDVAREALAPIREEMERLSGLADNLIEYGSPGEAAVGSGIREALQDIAEHVYASEELHNDHS